MQLQFSLSFPFFTFVFFAILREFIWPLQVFILLEPNPPQRKVNPKSRKRSCQAKVNIIQIHGKEAKASRLCQLLKKAALCHRSAEKAGAGLDLDLSHKSVPVWHCLCNPSNDPGIARCRIVDYDHYVTGDEVPLDLSISVVPVVVADTL